MKRYRSAPAKFTEASELFFEEVGLPLVVSIVPAGLFWLLGFVSKGLDNQDIEPPLLIIAAMIALQISGMIAMALVLLTGVDNSRRKLMLFTNGHPRSWRKLMLAFAFINLLLVDILTNISMAFPDGAFLLVALPPAYLLYLTCKRAAFLGKPMLEN